MAYQLASVVLLAQGCMAEEVVGVGNIAVDNDVEERQVEEDTHLVMGWAPPPRQKSMECSQFFPPKP